MENEQTAAKEASEIIPKLYKRLSVSDIGNIHKYFKESQSNGLDYLDFRDFLHHFGIKYNDNDFNNLCLKIDMDRDSRIKFHEFITYLVAEFQHDDKAAEKFSIIPPIPRTPRVLTVTAKNQIRRVFCVPMPSDESASYFTVGCSGDLSIWSLKWKLRQIIYLGSYVKIILYLPN